MREAVPLGQYSQVRLYLKLAEVRSVAHVVKILHPWTMKDSMDCGVFGPWSERAYEASNCVSGSESLWGGQEMPLNEVLQMKFKCRDLSVLETIYDHELSWRKLCALSGTWSIERLCLLQAAELPMLFVGQMTSSWTSKATHRVVIFGICPAVLSLTFVW